MAAYTEIDDPSLHFQIMLYAGSQGGSDPADGSTESYTFTDPVSYTHLTLPTIVLV